MDFGFMRASAEDYKQPNKATDRIVRSYDGFSAYLLVVDGASYQVWVFLTATKEPPLEILHAFMSKFGGNNGLIRLTRVANLHGMTRSGVQCSMTLVMLLNLLERTAPLKTGALRYTMVPLLSAYAPSSMVLASPRASSRPRFSTRSTYTTASCTRQLPKRHTRPGTAVNLICPTLRRSGHRSASSSRALDDANSTSMILRGYSLATLQLTKTLCTLTLLQVLSSCAITRFLDKAWYLQDQRPPAAQLLYNLGLEADVDPTPALEPITSPQLVLSLPSLFHGRRLP
jgi:hypothetical protein